MAGADGSLPCGRQERERNMSGGNRKLKRKRRFHKWMAIMLAVLLLTEQSDVFVRAEEGVGDVPQTEISSQETGTDTQDQDNTADGDNTENADSTGGGNTENPDNTGDGGDTGNPDNTGGAGEGNDNGGADDAGTGTDADGGNNAGTDGGNTGDGTVTQGEGTENQEEMKGDDTEKVPGADDKNIGDSTEGEDPQDQCICETACTEEALNADCPVCVAAVTQCAKNVGGGGKSDGRRAFGGGFDCE